MPRRGTAKLCRQHIFLVSFGQQMRSHPPRQCRPADEAKDQRDEEEPHLGRPFLRYEGGDRHEQRNRRHRSHGVGDHLQNGIDPTSVIAGYTANDQRQHEGDEDTDAANLKRGPDRMQGPREDILARGIGAKQMDVTVTYAEQVCFCRDEAKQLVIRAFHEELHITALVLIDLLDPAEIGLDRALTFNCVEEGSERTAILVTEHGDIRRPVHIVLVPSGDSWVIG